MQSAIAAPVVEVSGAKHRSSSWISLFLTKPSWEHVDTKSFIFSTIFQFYFEFAWQASWLSCFAYMPADYEALRGAFLIDSSVASSAAASKRSLNAFSKNFVVVIESISAKATAIFASACRSRSWRPRQLFDYVSQSYFVLVYTFFCF